MLFRSAETLAEIITEAKEKSGIPYSSKILISVAVFSILIGIAMIAYYSFKAKKGQTEKQEVQDDK